MIFARKEDTNGLFHGLFLFAQWLEPLGRRAVAGEGGVGAAVEADGAGEEPFGGVPKTDGVEDGVEEVGDGAVVDVFRVGVVDGVVVRRLEQADVLEEGDDGAVFPAGAVGPFVDFVGVGGDGGEEPRLPAEKAELPRDEEEDGGEGDEVPRALPPGVARHVARQVVVDDVGAANGGADERGVFADVGVFEPVDDAREEVSTGEHKDDLQQDDDGVFHTPGQIARFAVRALIDKNAGGIGEINHALLAGESPCGR